MAKNTSSIETEDPLELLSLGHRALGITGVDLANLLGVSRRTITRWYGKQTSIGTIPIGTLAPHVYARDPALAKRMHAYAAHVLARIGLPPPPPLPVSQPVALPPALAPAAVAGSAKLRVDAVVYAACEAVDAAPRAIRPALLAAFRRARELGVGVDDVERELAPVAAGKPRT